MRHLLRGVALAAACSVSLAQAAPIELKVMTQNVYIGAGLDPLFAPGAVVPLAVIDVLSAALATKAEERMTRVAQEIALKQPHIVGLQEAALWATQIGSNWVPGQLDATLPIPGIGISFADQIVAALAGMGLDYNVHALSKNGDNELPGVVGFGPLGPIFQDFRLTDYDAILVRGDLPQSELKLLGEGTGQFLATHSVDIGGLPVPLPRSYGYVDVEMSGIKLRVFNTHLEALDGGVSEDQALELIDAADLAPYRQVLLGDFNTISDDGTETLTDEFILGAGFFDAWLDKGTGDGFTWRDDPFLANLLEAFTQRLDYVFHRGGFNTLDVEVIGTAPFDVGGDGPPFWASDHAGVFAILQVVPVPGTAMLVVIALGALTATRRRPGYAFRD